MLRLPVCISYLHWGGDDENPTDSMESCVIETGVAGLLQGRETNTQIKTCCCCASSDKNESVSNFVNPIPMTVYYNIPSLELSMITSSLNVD